MNTMTFETYPDVMSDYEKEIENANYDNEIRIFTVPEPWGSGWIKRWTYEAIDEYDPSYSDVEYTWDDTWQMYEDAVKDGVLIEEHIESRVEVKETDEARRLLNWLLGMGYLEQDGIIEDGEEMAKDLAKIKIVAPKFYYMLMCVCY